MVSVYNNTKANESANILLLLKYSKEYVDSVGQDQFFHIEENTGAAEVREAQAAYNPSFLKRKN